MGRALDTMTASHTGDSTLTLAFFLRLDIANDPVVAWTGWSPKAFAAGATGDGAMDGQTFLGVTHLIGEIGTIEDSVGGSQALEISLPGVDVNDEALRQVVRDRRLWHFRQGWLWMAFLDDSLNVLGKPIRLKTGRMDQMVITEEDDGTGTCKVVLEGQQAYASEALGTMYVDTVELDPNDTSNKYVFDLANKNPVLQQASVGVGAGGISGHFLNTPTMRA